MRSEPQIQLKPGANATPLDGATARVWIDDTWMGPVWHVTVEVDGRERGSWSGAQRECEIWLEGFLYAALGTRSRTRAIAVDCVYAARDPKWPGGDAEIDAIIARHR